MNICYRWSHIWSSQCRSIPHQWIHCHYFHYIFIITVIIKILWAQSFLNWLQNWAHHSLAFVAVDAIWIKLSPCMENDSGLWFNIISLVNSPSFLTIQVWPLLLIDNTFSCIYIYSMPFFQYIFYLQYFDSWMRKVYFGLIISDTDSSFALCNNHDKIQLSILNNALTN